MPHTPPHPNRSPDMPQVLFVLVLLLYVGAFRLVAGALHLSREPVPTWPVTIVDQVICDIVALHRTSLVDHRGIAAMPKTMKQMKVIFKKYLQERVRVQRAASPIVAAYQAVLQAQHDLIVAAHQAALQEQHLQAVLQAQHDQLLQNAVDAHENGDTDDEWLIAHEYENEEWEDGV